ncbi:MAG: polyprenyl synthetase family protein [archaeon]
MNLKEAVNPYKEKIDITLKKFLDNKLNFNNKYLNNKYNNLKSYLMNGKKIRPLLCVLAYKSVNGKKDEIYDAAISLELFHNSTLVHDDIMDEDDKRRNLETIHVSDSKLYNKKDGKAKLFSSSKVRFGVSSAIITGDYCFTLGQIAIIESKFSDDLKLKILKVYNKVYQAVCIGQDLDIFMENNFEYSEEDYLEMIRNKTGNLIRESVEIGLILGNAKDTDKNILLRYAELIGLAFQIKDDLMSISKESDKGHDFGEDIKQNKTTLILIKALELSNNKDKKELLDLLNKEKDINDINRIIEIFYKTGAVDYCNKVCEKNIKEAKLILNKGNFDKDIKEIFIALADFFKDRRV